MDGPLTQHRRTPEQAKEMREKKEEAEKHERETKNYLAAYKEALKKASDKYEADLVKYAEKMEKYKHYKDHVLNWGVPTSKRKILKEPVEPAPFDRSKVKVPSNPSLYSDKFLEGGRRRTRRGRKHRSTRRR